MLALSTKSTCYMLPSHLPNSYPLNSRSQYQQYMLVVNFTHSQQLPSQCSLSVPTVFHICYIHIFPTATHSMLTLSTNLSDTCYLHTFPTATLSKLTVSTNCISYNVTFIYSQQLPTQCSLSVPTYLTPVIFILSQQLRSQSSLSVPIIPFNFTLSQQLPTQCSLPVPNLPVNCCLHIFPTATLLMLALSTNRTR